MGWIFGKKKKEDEEHDPNRPPPPPMLFSQSGGDAGAIDFSQVNHEGGSRPLTAEDFDGASAVQELESGGYESVPTLMDPSLGGVARPAGADQVVPLGGMPPPPPQMMPPSPPPPQMMPPPPQMMPPSPPPPQMMPPSPPPQSGGAGPMGVQESPPMGRVPDGPEPLPWQEAQVAGAPARRPKKPVPKTIVMGAAQPPPPKKPVPKTVVVGVPQIGPDPQDAPWPATPQPPAGNVSKTIVMPPPEPGGAGAPKKKPVPKTVLFETGGPGAPPGEPPPPPAPPGGPPFTEAPAQRPVPKTVVFEGGALPPPPSPPAKKPVPKTVLFDAPPMASPPPPISPAPPSLSLQEKPPLAAAKKPVPKTVLFDAPPPPPPSGDAPRAGSKKPVPKTVLFDASQGAPAHEELPSGAPPPSAAKKPVPKTVLFDATRELGTPSGAAPGERPQPPAPAEAMQAPPPFAAGGPRGGGRACPPPAPHLQPPPTARADPPIPAPLASRNAPPGPPISSLPLDGASPSLQEAIPSNVLKSGIPRTLEFDGRPPVNQQTEAAKPVPEVKSDPVMEAIDEGVMGGTARIRGPLKRQQEKVEPLKEEELRLARSLLALGLVSQAKLSEQLERTGRQDTPLGQALKQAGFVDEDDLFRVILSSFKLPTMAIATLRVPLEVIAAIPEDTARKCRVLPLEEIGDILVVVSTEVLDPERMLTLQRETDKKIIAIHCLDPESFDGCLSDHYRRLRISRLPLPEKDDDQGLRASSHDEPTRIARVAVPAIGASFRGTFIENKTVGAVPVL